MKEKIIEYLKEHPYSSCSKLAEGLNVNERNVLGVMNELSKDGIATITPLPLGNKAEPDNSVYYSLTKRHSR